MTGEAPRDPTRWRAARHVIRAWRAGNVQHDRGPTHKVRMVHFLKALR